MTRFDRYWIGILLGLLLPAVVCLLYVDRMNLWYVFESINLWHSPVFTKLLTVSIFPNMALLFLFYTTDTWRLAKGVMLGALPYVLAAIITTI